MSRVIDSILSRLPFHYGWFIAFTGMLSILACLGFARFVLGMILPSMSEALRLDYVEMGLLGTGNFFGYLIAVLFAGRFIALFGARVSIFAGLTLAWVSMLLLGFSSSLAILVFLFALTGIGSGITNVSVMGLVSRWFERDKRGRASGFIVIGSGFALIISGWFVPIINSNYLQEGWRVNWWLSALIVFVVSIINLITVRNSPEEMSLRPIGCSTTKEDGPLLDLRSSLYTRGIALHLGIIYLLFGFSYVIYITFAVTAFVNEYGFPESVAGKFWSLIGLLSLFSGPVFGSLSDRFGRGRGLMIVFFIQMLAYGLAATGMNGMPLYLSVLFFGITGWAIPSIMAAAAGDYFGPVRAPAAFGYITFIFGIGQITGPIAAGMVADVTGGFSSSFAMASAAAAIAIVLSSFLKRPEAYSG